MKLGSVDVNAAVITWGPADVNAKVQIETALVGVIGFEHKVVAGLVEVSANATVPDWGAAVPVIEGVIAAVKTTL